MDPQHVAERVVGAIEADEPYVFTHADYRTLVEARFDAILSAFGETAHPGFHESSDVLRMMTPFGQAGG